MRNFQFYSPTRIFFGEGQVEALGEQVKKYGDKILLVYGKGSIKRNGIYEAVVAQLQAHEIEYVELSGVDPNPRLATVLEGRDLCREHDLRFVLAVGGGSVIDCAKGIAATVPYDGDPWDFWLWKVPVKEALPVGSVLTLSATGSEMNGGTVITNEETTQKHGMGGEALVPKFSVLDPTYTYSVPQYHTAAGVADILAHVFEFYFSPVDSAYLTDGLAEAVIRTCIKYGPIAYTEPENYEARANLMWAGTLALNGTVATGKTFDGFNHSVEHAISAIYDLTHGVGLAILAIHWMNYVLGDDTVGQFVLFARNVWGLDGDDDFELARAGIQKLAEFYRSLGLPGQLSEVEIGDDQFDEIVAKAVRNETIGSFKELTKQDVLNILEHAK